MDRLETWEIPFTSACERTGSSGSRSNNDPGLEGPSDLPGAQTARHEARRSAWTSEAKQISDRGCVAGSRSTPIGPVTSGNRTHLDPIEERGVPCGENRWRETRERTLSLTNLATRRERIAGLARTQRGVALSTLHHLIDLEWMQEAYRLTRKDGAPGIDGVMADAYARNLEANLLDLLDRIKTGRYQAPPVRRTYIPKADGSRRPLGIPTFEDKVAQRAIVMVLEAVFEQDFLPCSFGFRPGRSAHQALQYLRAGFMSQRLRWVIDIDIKKYFDSIPHSHLRDFLDRRVIDGVIRRMIDKWLKAGILEDGVLRHTTEGSPQGDVISPCLSNIFLHHVLDEWFEHEVRPRLAGRCTLVRFADDAVMAFEDVLDAKRVLGVLGKRLARYGLTLHPDKTRFVDFRNTASNGMADPARDGTTFTALRAVSSIAWAQAYPTRTVRFILPFGAGSASDTTARLFAERLSARWGKPVVVENRPGGDGLVSLDAFVGAHEDHTMWFGPAGTFNVLPYQHDTLPFDPKRDLNPIASVSEVVLAVSTPISMNVNSIDELVAMARAQPGKLNAAAANGISDFLLFGFFKSMG